MENEITQSYLNQIQKYPLLTSSEEQELSKKIASGNKDALSALINSNLRLVVSVSHNFRSSNIPVMDLIQEGNIGLMIAAKKFHYSFNTRFSTYAYPWIMQYMLRYANSRYPFIALPHRKDDMIRKIQNAKTLLFQENGVEPSYKEIADYIDIPEEIVLEHICFDYNISSLDAETGDEEGNTAVIDLISDNTYSPELSLMNEEECKHVRSLIDALPHNERKVILYRYNFIGEKKTKTLREISSIMGVTPEAVRQAELRAIRRLRQAVEIA